LLKLKNGSELGKLKQGLADNSICPISRATVLSNLSLRSWMLQEQQLELDDEMGCEVILCMFSFSTSIAIIRT